MLPDGTEFTIDFDKSDLPNVQYCASFKGGMTNCQALGSGEISGGSQH
jgi:hypothetical protein